MKRDSGRPAERGDAKLAPSEGCQSGPKASPGHYRDTPTDQVLIDAIFGSLSRNLCALAAAMDDGRGNEAAKVVAERIYTAMQAARSEIPEDTK